MIKTLLLTDDGQVQRGGIEQIDLWRKDDNTYLWIDIESEDVDDEKDLLLEQGCHPLAIEDAQRKRHPPKTETFDNHVLIRYSGITDFDEDLNINQVPIALFVEPRCLISIHQGRSVSVEKNWANPEIALLRKPAMLAVRVMHYSVGRYLDVVLTFEARINDLEDLMQERPNDELMRTLIAFKSRLRKLKRTFNYHERVAASLLHETPDIFIQQSPDTGHALQDLFDRSERVNSLTAMYYEICGDLIEGYLSLSSHTLNNTMRVLTVITAIFVPLTFIAGIYGMNFEYIPELQFRYGYFIAMGLMATMGAVLLGVFRKLRWL
ncbi:magnesium transporter CorA family protein [Gilvimarinus polysaccharolyticus]|uniref:magnesium transporter CorA family protein n=1 Tax=Gilvimarinus polysaccharolyticus TaxID=863921 RepID=UPI0006731DA3|nr:magnesium transporter CorA family protein [Gilvimarinus polysaccharolyticus]